MKPKIYLETTIGSYLSAWPSRDLITAAHQQITREWWQARREEFELFISEIVIQESGGGDQQAASRRLEILKDLPLLELTEEATAFAQELIEQVPLPEKATVDALHIALAVVHGMDYLLTWNCTHIANAALRSKIEAVCRSKGYEPPVICTPEELLQENSVMSPDPLVAEVRAIREAYAKQFNYDLQAIHRDLKEKERKSGRKVIMLPPRYAEAMEQMRSRRP